VKETSARSRGSSEAQYTAARERETGDSRNSGYPLRAAEIEKEGKVRMSAAIMGRSKEESQFIRARSGRSRYRK